MWLLVFLYPADFGGISILNGCPLCPSWMWPWLSLRVVWRKTYDWIDHFVSSLAIHPQLLRKKKASREFFDSWNNRKCQRKESVSTKIKEEHLFPATNRLLQTKDCSSHKGEKENEFRAYNKKTWIVAVRKMFFVHVGHCRSEGTKQRTIESELSGVVTCCHLISFLICERNEKTRIHTECGYPQIPCTILQIPTSADLCEILCFSWTVLDAS